jgi:hypothetical protein
MLLLLPLHGISSASFSFPESPEKKNKLIGTLQYRTGTVLVVAELLLIISPLSVFRNRSLYNRARDWDPSHQALNLRDA